MARATLLQPNKQAADHATASHFHTGAPATSLLLLLLFLVAAAVAAVVVSLCTSGKNARPRRSSSLVPAPQQEQEQDGGGSGSGNKKQLLASLSGIGVKAAAVAKMVSWNRRSPPPASSWSSGGDDGDIGDGDGAAEDEEEALWKKTIILGDKCRPLEFSGHIAHDSDGNPVQPQPSPAVVGDQQGCHRRFGGRRLASEGAFVQLTV